MKFYDVKKVENRVLIACTISAFFLTLLIFSIMILVLDRFGG